ncbi:universal stress protein [Halobaculum halobium]|uniref:Universal stress protein n=1 Tax=Halobaculum halobium TaxID=3032281 RepID=A0ABD5T5Q5_9EURY|nr:universal stress protein [Halobaculum sp. SYNS20]
MSEATGIEVHDILVPTDGSKAAMKAARQAIDLANKNDATVHAMYVMDMGDADFVAVPSDIAETRTRLEKKGRGFTNDISELAGEAGVDCVTVVKSGIPEDEIIEYAEAEGVDLIVIGKRGRADPDKPLIGSTTKRVLGRTEVPVRVV